MRMAVVRASRCELPLPPCGTTKSSLGQEAAFCGQPPISPILSLWVKQEGEMLTVVMFISHDKFTGGRGHGFSRSIIPFYPDIDKQMIVRC